MKLLEQFSFRDQIVRPIRSAAADSERPQTLLNFNSLEALRRAFVAAIKSIEIAANIGLSEPPAVASGASVSSGLSIGEGPPATAGGSHTKLSTFIEEVRRS